MLCRSVFRAGSLRLRTRAVPAFVLSCAQLRRLPASATVCPVRGFAQGGGKEFGKSRDGDAARKVNTWVRCEFEGKIHELQVGSTSFFADVRDIIAQKIEVDFDELTIEIKQEDEEWVDIDDIFEEEQPRSKVEIRVTRRKLDDEQSPIPEDEQYKVTDGKEDGLMVVEVLARAAVSEGKVRKGGAMTAEQARAWIMEYAEVNEDVRTFILNSIGGFDHLIEVLQFPFTFNGCFDEPPE